MKRVSVQAIIGCGDRADARSESDAAISRAATSVVMVRCASADIAGVALDGRERSYGFREPVTMADHADM